MVERREGTSTEGAGLGFSFAADNVERGEEDADFIKRRPTYPLGDDPRGREIDFEALGTEEAYGSTRNPVVRAYRGRAPLEGQSYSSPSRSAKLPKVTSLRPERPNRTVNTAALDFAKDQERAVLESTNFQALFPTVTLDLPAPGDTFSPGDRITIKATVSDIRSVHAATLEIDSRVVDRRVLDRREQDSTKEHQFIFLYDVPPNRGVGPMDITVRGFNMMVSAQGMIADDAPNTSPEISQALGTLDGRLGQSYGSQAQAPLLDTTGLLRTPEGISSITINII